MPKPAVGAGNLHRWRNWVDSHLATPFMPHAMPPENRSPSKLRASGTIRKARQALRLREIVAEIFYVARAEIS